MPLASPYRPSSWLGLAWYTEVAKDAVADAARLATRMAVRTFMMVSCGAGCPIWSIQVAFFCATERSLEPAPLRSGDLPITLLTGLGRGEKCRGIWFEIRSMPPHRDEAPDEHCMFRIFRKRHPHYSFSFVPVAQNPLPHAAH